MPQQNKPEDGLGSEQSSLEPLTTPAPDLFLGVLPLPPYDWGDLDPEKHGKPIILTPEGPFILDEREK